MRGEGARPSGPEVRVEGLLRRERGRQRILDGGQRQAAVNDGESWHVWPAGHGVWLTTEVHGKIDASGVVTAHVATVCASRQNVPEALHAGGTTGQLGS
jgi:hypothetical protein